MNVVTVDTATDRCARSATGARAATRAFLEALGHSSIAAEAADTVVLVVSELATNALRHGGGAFDLRLTAHPDTIEVAVDDSSPRLPRLRTPDLRHGTGGFGWPMVNRLATATAVSPRPCGGKTVRAFLPRW
ncbi:ATP-binding protein [Streptomyces sp. cmx-4-9]|uniref:ATP-binding protein n=1 Tax=Streptomyces sp. cmx-4-9 TaxID=2790941 RepID=UPI00397F2DCF